MSMRGTDAVGNFDGTEVEDNDGTELADDTAARAHAEAVVQELMVERKLVFGRHWSAWSMSVRDADGVERFSFLFSDVGRAEP